MTYDNELKQKHKDRCLTCKHWRGNRAAAFSNAKTYAGAMDFPGYAGEGDCAQRFEFIDINLAGCSGIESVEFTASFGCMLWESFDA